VYERDKKMYIYSTRSGRDHLLPLMMRDMVRCTRNAKKQSRTRPLEMKKKRMRSSASPNRYLKTMTNPNRERKRKRRELRIQGIDWMRRVKNIERTVITKVHMPDSYPLHHSFTREKSVSDHALISGISITGV